MRMRTLAVVAIFVFSLGLSAGVASAATGMTVDIPFSFVVKDKEMPAGRYEIRPDGSDENQLVIKNAKGSGTMLVTVVERLADTGAKEPKVVFDKMADGKSYVSEVHIPGMDGFLVGIAKGRETHVMVSGKE
jgi:hypothetical protein